MGHGRPREFTKAGLNIIFLWGGGPQSYTKTAPKAPSDIKMLSHLKPCAIQ